MIQRLAAHPQDLATISALIRLARLVMPLPIGLNLWKVQNTYWGLVPQFSRQTTGETEETPEAAQAAIQALNGQAVGDRKLTVSEARPREDRPAFNRAGRDPRRGGHSGGGGGGGRRY